MERKPEHPEKEKPSKDVQPSRSEVEVLTATEPPWKDHIEAFRNKTGIIKRIVQDFELAGIHHCTVNGKSIVLKYVHISEATPILMQNMKKKKSNFLNFNEMLK